MADLAEISVDKAWDARPQKRLPQGRGPYTASRHRLAVPGQARSESYPHSRVSLDAPGAGAETHFWGTLTSPWPVPDPQVSLSSCNLVPLLSVTHQDSLQHPQRKAHSTARRPRRDGSSYSHNAQGIFTRVAYDRGSIHPREMSCTGVVPGFPFSGSIDGRPASPVASQPSIADPWEATCGSSRQSTR